MSTGLALWKRGEMGEQTRNGVIEGKNIRSMGSWGVQNGRMNFLSGEFLIKRRTFRQFVQESISSHFACDCLLKYSLPSLPLPSENLENKLRGKMVSAAAMIEDYRT